MDKTMKWVFRGCAALTIVAISIIGGFIITIALRKTGFLKRLSYMTILLCGGTTRGILYGLMIVGILVAAIITDPMAKAILLGTLVIGICDALDIQKGSKNGTVLGMATFAITLAPSFIFMTSTGFMSVVSILSTAGYHTPAYIEYLFHMAVPQIIYCFITVLMIDLLFRPEPASKSKDFFKEELAKLGKITTNEWKLLAICAFLMIMLVTTSYHGLLTAWVFLMVAIMTMLPGIDLVEAEDIKGINFTFVMFVVACLTIGIVSNKYGVGTFIANLVSWS